MSFLGKLFGTDKARDSLIEGAIKGFDSLKYTHEERAADNAASITEARSMLIEWLKNTQGQNLARRIISLSVTSIWLMQYIIMQVLSVSAVWVDEPDRLMESSKVIGDYAESMNGAMMLILAFYFAAPHMGKIVDSAMNKFSGTIK